MAKGLKGLVVLELTVHSDERGWLAELLHGRDLEHKEFGQLLVTVARPGVTKGGHYHTRKEEWFVVIAGEGELRLEDNKTSEKKTIQMGGKNMVAVSIPTQVFHWITNVGKDDLYLMAYCNEEFDPDDADTFPAIGQ